MKSFVQGFLLAMGIIGCTVLGVVWLQNADPDEGGLPIIHELTDTYLLGWKVVSSQLTTTHFESPINLVQNSLNTSSPNKAKPQVAITWKRGAIEDKLKEKGFSKRRLKQAGAYLDYIEQYKGDALRDMYRTKVPAAITLAQGLLESNAGRSRLAKKTNNHFGIKARHRPSARKKIKQKRFDEIYDEDFSFVAPAVGVSRHHDDHKYDRFEVYHNVQDSYQRHSALLTRACTSASKGCYAWIWEAFPIGEEKVDISLEARRFQSASGMTPAAFFDGETRLPYFAAQAAGLKMAGYATSPTYHRHITYLIETYELWRFDIDLTRAIQNI